MKQIIVFLFISVFFFSCNENFSPNGPYEQRLIIYSVLDASTDTQYVRILSTYSPQEYNPANPVLNREVTGASVVVNNGIADHVFQDTVITYTNSLGEVKNSRVYVNKNFSIQQERTLSIKVNAPGYTEAKAQSVAVIPGETFVQNGLNFFQNNAIDFIPINVVMGINARAYLLTLHFIYAVQNGSVWDTLTTEIPYAVTLNQNDEVTQKHFPKITNRSNNNGIGGTELVNISTTAYRRTVNEIRDKYDGKVVRFRWVRLNLKQFDSELFSYYSVTNNFPGATTLRLDEPDYTNVSGGYGIFGNITNYTRSYYVPPDL